MKDIADLQISKSQIGPTKKSGEARVLTNFLRLPDRLICLSRIDQAERFA